MKLRYERKFLVPNKMLDSLRARVLTFAKPDAFAKRNCEDLMQYQVRSIYFDTPDLRFYKEKWDGIEFRRKFRIRGYDTYSPDNKVVFEIKRKIGNRIRKHRAFTYYRDLNDLLATGNVEKYVIKDGKIKDPVSELSRYFYHLKKDQIIPTVLVVYEREAYHGKIDHGARITLDKNIRSRLYPHMGNLYDDDKLKYLFDSHFVLEIKYYTDNMPVWGRSLVQEFKLRHDAISKYTIGVDVNKHKTYITY